MKKILILTMCEVNLNYVKRTTISSLIQIKDNPYYRKMGYQPKPGQICSLFPAPCSLPSPKCPARLPIAEKWSTLSESRIL